ncbi:GRAS family transcription factor [Rhynchospora pubera]|uniref:GRAS family transcription factor n=1 Tax=Rhynchospora pubera TaxID=906938 RepID=A0AAV8F683_9POAL|nr:GRAS family transcription factor [Rhynchospora pubera]
MVLIETTIYIPNAINSIACEGLERVFRPETYKQWKARHLRAGLEPVPVDSLIMENIKKFVRECYHKNFFIDEDDRWVVMGWKGRILCAMSIWKPNEI